MKNFLCLILCCLILSCVNFQTSFVAAEDSNNSFEIELKEAPAGGGSKPDSGLSDGAVTAITLGSIFGGLAVLGGAGYYFLKHHSGLACGFACGEKCPYQLVGLENPEIITKGKHTYLMKAYENTKKESGQKFLIIPDTNINPNTYNTVFFEIPKEYSNSRFEIVQASSKLNISENMPEVESDIFLKTSVKIPTTTTKINSGDGIVIKQGKITNNDGNVLELVTSYKPKTKHAGPVTYAVIVRLSDGVTR